MFQGHIVFHHHLFLQGFVDVHVLAATGLSDNDINLFQLFGRAEVSDSIEVIIYEAAGENTSLGFIVVSSASITFQLVSITFNIGVISRLCQLFAIVEYACAISNADTHIVHKARVAHGKFFGSRSTLIHNFCI